MKNRMNIIVWVLGVFFVFCLFGYYFIFNQKEKIKKENLIMKETVSPNEDYVDSEKDKVFYTIKIYQNDNHIIVRSSSNSAFTKKMEYKIKYDKKITKEDIQIEWTTLMGDTNYTKENEIAVAVVTLSYQGEVFSQRKISFVGKAIDTVVDAIN